jgi:hypothetical protein
MTFLVSTMILMAPWVRSQPDSYDGYRGSNDYVIPHCYRFVAKMQHKRRDQRPESQSANDPVAYYISRARQRVRGYQKANSYIIPKSRLSPPV